MFQSDDVTEGTRPALGMGNEVLLWQIVGSDEVKELDVVSLEKWPIKVLNPLINASSRSSLTGASTPKKKVRFKNYGATESPARMREDDSVTFMIRIRNVHDLNQLTLSCGFAVIVSLLIVIIVLILFRYE